MEKRIPFSSTVGIAGLRKNEGGRRGTHGAYKTSKALRDGAGHFKKIHRTLHKATGVKYMFIKEHRKQFGLKLLCEVLAISRSG